PSAATSSAYSAGVAAGSANTAAATTSAYNAGVATGSANTAAAYNAGMAAGAATAPTAATGSAFMMGGIYATLPAGCVSPKVQGSAYYLCGNTWFQPTYGANGVSYRVVPGPSGG